MDKKLDQNAIASRLLPLIEPRLRDLVRRRPYRVWADTARCYAIVLLAFSLLATSDHWGISLLSFVLIGTQQYALFILGHDGLHSNLLPRRSANDLFTGLILLVPLGMYLNDQRVNHLSHHRLLGTQADPDRYLHAAGNKATRAKFLFFLSGLMTFPRTVIKVSPFGKCPHAQSQPAVNYLATRRPALLAQGALFLGIWLFFPWWYYLLFWVLPVYALVFLPDEIRAFCEHAQPILPDNAGDAKRLVTFLPNVIERILFAPLNMNLHAEHHLWPFIPYYNLPATHQLVCNTQDIEIRRSYLGFLWTYFRRLPLDGPVWAPERSA